MQTNLGLRLRDTLGPEASQDLSHAFEEAQHDMLTMTTERFEGRLIAVDQLLNAIFLIMGERAPIKEDWEAVRETVMRALNEE